MTVVDRGRQMRSSYRRHAKCPGFTRARALCSGEGLLAEKVSPGQDQPQSTSLYMYQPGLVAGAAMTCISPWPLWCSLAG